MPAASSKRPRRRERFLGFIVTVAVEDVLGDEPRDVARQRRLHVQQVDLERLALLNQLDDVADRTERIAGAVDRHQCLEHGDLHPKR